MKRYLKAVLLFVAISTAVVIYVFYFYKPSGRNINKLKYPITGIDVSKHTGKVNFKLMVAQKVDFVYIKASEGSTNTDPKFESYYTAARKTKIAIGAYHFFRFNKSGKAQAKNFLRSIKNKKYDLPPVIDVEEWGNIKNIPADSVIARMGTFIKEVKAKLNMPVMIYTNESGYRQFVKGHFDKHYVWICSFNAEPNIDKDWTLWQYNHDGNLKGAEGMIDMNTFNGGRSSWKKFIQ